MGLAHSDKQINTDQLNRYRGNKQELETSIGYRYINTD